MEVEVDTITIMQTPPESEEVVMAIQTPPEMAEAIKNAESGLLPQRFKQKYLHS